jgi:hypothetical protein
MKLTGTWVCMFCGTGGELGLCTATSKHGCLHFAVIFQEIVTLVGLSHDIAATV